MRGASSNCSPPRGYTTTEANPRREDCAARTKPDRSRRQLVAVAAIRDRRPVLETNDALAGNEIAERLSGQALVAVPLEDGSKECRQIGLVDTFGNGRREPRPGGVPTEPDLVAIDRIADEADLRDVRP